MLSLFPGLLFLAPLATTIVRVAAGLMFLYMAYRMVATRDTIMATRLPLVGHVGAWVVWLAALITVVVGFLLVVGMWTQAAAIAGMLISIKHGLGARKYPEIVPFAGSAYILLFVICLSLLFSGAGAFAIDLPL